MNQPHQPGNTIAQRYRLEQVLGQGGIATTFAATDLHTGQQVALKALSLRRMKDFKVLDLFEREARTLEQLNHPAIPQYLDYFQVEQADNRVFYLVQQLAQGKTLADLVEAGWRPNEDDVRAIAIQLLETLVYLQQRVPPVIHRDIKPQNIICNEDGRVFLVDFGAVQDTYHNTLTGGSTVVGTYGYMAPEQFRGQAVLGTDLYGLGTTLIFLLSGKTPADLPQRKLKINFRPHIQVSQAFADWLERMVEPVADDRFQTAEDALAVLLGKRSLVQVLTPPLDRPSRSPVTIIRDDDQLLIKIPPTWLRSTHSRLLALLPLAANGFLLVMLWLIAASSRYMTPASWLLLLIYGGFSVGMAAKFLISAASQTRLTITASQVRLKRSLWGAIVDDVDATPADLIKAELTPSGMTLRKTPLTICTVQIKRSRYRFGLFLTEAEKAWIVREIDGERQRIKGRRQIAEGKQRTGEG
jgi:eukaryotic-like serine/threonine-protein kinase